jgi:tetratricopeptide (TPR) repeat protein
VDARSDVFSLGVILFELLTRCRPYKSSNDVDDLDTMVTERRAGPPGLRRWNPAISPAVEAIVRRSLEPDPAKRYQSARDFQEDLQRQLQDLPLKHAAEPSLADRGRKWLRRHPRLTSWTTAAVVTAVALAATASWVVARGQRLAGLEAAAALARFDDDAKSAHFLLTARTTDRDQLDRGIAQGRELLGRYQVLQDPNWQQRSAVRHLAAGDRERLRQDAGALLLLVARAEALDSPDRDRLGDALALNRRAEDCFPAGAGPRVLWQQRGQLLEQLGDAAGAGAARATAEATPLSTARDHYLLGAEHATRGRYREALPHLEEATRRDPQSFWAAFLQGLCHDGLTQDAEALASFRACAALRPDFPWTYFNRGLVYLRQKDYRHARAEFDRAIDLEPDAAEAYVNRALALQGLGQHREAVADLTHALDLGVPQTRVYFMRALARERLGDKEGAKRDREIGLRERPTDDRSWLARGLARLPDLEAALADFREAYKLNPRSQAALQNMAHALGRLGRTEEAVKSLDTALDLYPDYAPARSGRGVLLARLGKRDAALSDAREALRRDTRAPTLYQAAGIYALTSKQVADDRREAFRLLAAALRQGFGFDLLAIDRDLDPIRDDPEFRELVAAARALTGLPRKAESQGGTKD